MKRPELKKRLWRLIADEAIIVTNDNLDWLLERVYKEHEAEQNGVEEEALLKLANTHIVVLKELGKTRAMCNLLIQMSLYILQNQYRVNALNREKGEEACKSLEEMVTKTLDNIERMFDEEPKKPDPKEWLKVRNEE